MTQPGDSTTGAAAPSSWRTRPPWIDRVGSLVAGGLLLFAAVRWWYVALALTNPCRSSGLDQEVCSEPPEILQSLQFVIAIAGIAVAVVVAGLTLFQAISGRRVPWLRVAVAILAGLAVGWVLVYLIGWLSV